jgi:hypothetical protein
MSEREPFDGPPIGFFELDGAGTVLYFKPDRGDAPEVQVVGRNFYRDIEAVCRSRDFQEKVKGFGRGRQPADQFTHTFDPDHGGLRVKVLLARIHEQTPEGGADSVFVHIKQA